MTTLKAVLTPSQTAAFEAAIVPSKIVRRLEQYDVYYRNIDMESSISKHAVRVRRESREGGGDSFTLTYNVLSESSTEWAELCEVTSAADGNIYTILSATGFKRLATLSKTRTEYSHPFRMTRDDIFGFGTIVKAECADADELSRASELLKGIGVTSFEKRKNLEIFLEYIRSKTEKGKDASIKRIKTDLAALMKNRDGAMIGIAGGSGSGKTFVAGELRSWFPGAVVFTLDDYYRDRSWIVEHLNSNFDDPGAIDLGLARRHLLELKNGSTIKRPKRSLEAGRVVGHVDVKPAKLVVVEGIFALCPELYDLYDYSIFIEANLHGKLLRRLMRDIGKTGQDFAGIVLQYVSTVQPMYEKHIEPTKNAASLIVDNEFAPFCETYERIDRFEFKVRSVLAVSPASLRGRGVEPMESVHQIDKYYVAPGLNFMESDELLRIREENQRLTLTYKGPRKGSFQRPRIDFPIDYKFAEVLLYLGYSNPITVDKMRHRFRAEKMPELDIVVDEVKNLGAFIEVRVDSAENEKKARRFLREIGAAEMEPDSGNYFMEILKKSFNL